MILDISLETLCHPFESRVRKIALALIQRRFRGTEKTSNAFSVLLRLIKHGMHTVALRWRWRRRAQILDVRPFRWPYHVRAAATVVYRECKREPGERHQRNP